MEEHKKTVIQQGEEIAKLTAKVNRLEEEATDLSKSLEDMIKINDGLLSQVASLERGLNEKDERIYTLMEEHNNLVHENNDNEVTIASLIKDRQHCQC